MSTQSNALDGKLESIQSIAEQGLTPVAAQSKEQPLYDSEEDGTDPLLYRSPDVYTMQDSLNMPT